MRKYCWLYEHKENGNKILVQRPHRRAINPTYSAVYKVGSSEVEVISLTSKELGETYKFIGRSSFDKAFN